jgi:SAM-dependent methyltransferase
MPLFADYAQFYDLLYRDKPYKKECAYLNKIFNRYSKRPVKFILNLGCGTGNHDLILTHMGYHVTGVDLSGQMIKIAKKKAAEKKLDITFLKQDLRKLNLGRRFDAVVSLFAVMGYQTTNKDFQKALETAFSHLRPGGLFVFDVWFGPAVLIQKPQLKTKKIRLGKETVERKTSPKLDIANHIVSVHFETKFFKENKLIKKNQETHQMRFFFYQELHYFLEQVGFHKVSVFPFLRLQGQPTETDWNITVIAQK